MDRSLLAARIQEILKGRGRPARPEAVESVACGDDARARDRYSDEESGQPARVREVLDEAAAFAARCAADEAASRVSDVLGGRIVEGPGGRCMVIDRDYAAAHVHGRRDVARYAAAVSSGNHALSWFLGSTGQGAPPHRLLFFDLETTGLSGGAGTYAFLVGCGWFDGEAFTTRQFFLRGYGEERALLETVQAFVHESATEAASWPAAGGQASVAVPPCLITYNGRSFDLPLIETRYLFHRRTSPFASLPHVDMLFPARRLWRRRALRELGGPVPEGPALVSPADLRASCALTALEQDILGLRRQDDVPGWEIPTRYFGYTRTGDAAGLVGVLEHNRLDLLSLAAVTALILERVVEQDRLVRDRHDCVALARLLEHLGRGEDAERCYERAAASDGLLEGEADRVARVEALHWLAIHRRRAHRFAEAAEAWRGLLRIPGLDRDLRREACEALAVHHEHRARDLEAARSFALLALDVARGGRFAGGVEHRLGRLTRKLGGPAGDEELSPIQSAFPIDD